MRSSAFPVVLSFLGLAFGSAEFGLPNSARPIGIVIATTAVKYLRSKTTKEETIAVLANEVATVIHLLGVENLEAERRAASEYMNGYFYGEFWQNLIKEVTFNYRPEIYRSPIQRETSNGLFVWDEIECPYGFHRDDQYGEDHNDKDSDQEEDMQVMISPYCERGIRQYHRILALVDMLDEKLRINELSKIGFKLACGGDLDIFSDYVPRVVRTPQPGEPSTDAEYEEWIRSHPDEPAFWAVHMYTAYGEVMQGGQTLADQITFKRLVGRVTAVARNAAESIRRMKVVTPKMQRKQIALAEEKRRHLGQFLSGDVTDPESIQNFISREIMRPGCFAFFGRHQLIKRAEWMALEGFAADLASIAVEHVDEETKNSPVHWMEMFLRLSPNTPVSVGLDWHVVYFQFRKEFDPIFTRKKRELPIREGWTEDEELREVFRRGNVIIAEYQRHKSVQHVKLMILENPEGEFVKTEDGNDRMGWLIVKSLHNGIRKLMLDK